MGSELSDYEMYSESIIQYLENRISGLDSRIDTLEDKILKNKLSKKSADKLNIPFDSNELKKLSSRRLKYAKLLGVIRDINLIRYYEIDYKSSEILGELFSKLSREEKDALSSVVNSCIIIQNKESNDELRKLQQEALRFAKSLGIEEWEVVVKGKNHELFQVDYIIDRIKSLKSQEEKGIYFTDETTAHIISDSKAFENKNIVRIPKKEISDKDVEELIRREIKEEYNLILNDEKLNKHLSGKIKRNIHKIVELEFENEMLSRKIISLNTRELDRSVFGPVIEYIERLKIEASKKIKKNNIELNRVVSLGELKALKEEAKKNEIDKNKKEELERIAKGRVEKAAYELEKMRHSNASTAQIQKLERELNEMLHVQGGVRVDLTEAREKGIERFRKEESEKKFRKIEIERQEVERQEKIKEKSLSNTERILHEAIMDLYNVRGGHRPLRIDSVEYRDLRDELLKKYKSTPIERALIEGKANGRIRREATLDTLNEEERKIVELLVPYCQDANYSYFGALRDFYGLGGQDVEFEQESEMRL